MENEARYRDRDVVYAGVRGVNLAIPSANPVNYHQAITDPEGCEPIEVDAKLFLPEGAEAPAPVVVLAPGSLGVGENMEAHAATLLGAGFGVCMIDPFGARSVESTVGNQAQFSFAASAFDVVRTLMTLRETPGVDRDRIGAQGHSRGGSAVITAACRQFADAVGSPDAAFHGIYAAYPWCGHQFRNLRVGATRLRAIIGDLDEWCSVPEAQGQFNALRAGGADAELRLVIGAHHSFDREEEPHVVEDSVVARGAPTVMFADDGASLDPRTGRYDPALVDRDHFVLAAQGGYTGYGARIGGVDGQLEVFVEDMLAFHRVLQSSP